GGVTGALEDINLGDTKNISVTGTLTSAVKDQTKITVTASVGNAEGNLVPSSQDSVAKPAADLGVAADASFPARVNLGASNTSDYKFDITNAGPDSVPHATL